MPVVREYASLPLLPRGWSRDGGAGWRDDSACNCTRDGLFVQLNDWTIFRSTTGQSFNRNLTSMGARPEV
eukprot:3554571-Rhodomonas_salina.1